MPFRSKAQMRYLFSQQPKLAREFAAKTPDMRALPEHKLSQPMVQHLKRHYGRKK